MISIKINKHVLAKAKGRVDGWGTRLYRDAVYKMFNELLKVSYQFSGDFTSNWRIVSAADSLPSYSPLPNKTNPKLKQWPFNGAHQAGDRAAIDVALARQPRSSLKFKVGDKVSFYNPTPLTFTGTTVTGPGGTKPLRPVNVIGNGILLTTYMRRKFKME